jgi:hypothetical protein
MSLLSRFFGRKGSPPSPPVTAADGPHADLADFIRRQVAAGFADEGVILTDAVEVFADDIEPGVLRREAQRLLREAIGDHARAQGTWTQRTDCDRLDEAFAALEADGIVARQHFTCCNTCGSSEIWDEIASVRDAGGTVRGYAFYHVQDTDRAVDGDGLYLGYGATEEGEAAALAVAHDIVAELARQGLRTSWTGSWDQRIAVTLDWHRRR